MSEPIRVGTRGSRLAMWQTEWVVQRLRSTHPQIPVRVEIIRTTGDHIQDVALSRIGEKGLFTKELDRALLEERIDIAVHSMKDVPTAIPEGLRIAAITEREDPRDALVAKTVHQLEQLPRGATLATGSLRRRAQLLHLRPDLQIVELRGNVPTRLEKWKKAPWEGLILAVAGLRRLGLEKYIRQKISPTLLLPAVGQGSFAIMCRATDERMDRLLAPLHHAPSACAIQAERALLRHLEGGCQVPIGALAWIQGEQLILQACLADLDGKRLIRETGTGSPADPEALGLQVAEQLLQKGGKEILQDIRDNA